MAKQRYSLTFPFRWLKEDRKYLKKNLTRLLGAGKTQMPMHPTLIDAEPIISGYGVRFSQHAYQPKPYKMTKEEITEILQDAFPTARCIVFEKMFVQKSTSSGLPVMEMEVFY
jgi:hypothetical protein